MFTNQKSDFRNSISEFFSAVCAGMCAYFQSGLCDSHQNSKQCLRNLLTRAINYPTLQMLPVITAALMVSLSLFKCKYKCTAMRVNLWY